MRDGSVLSVLGCRQIYSDLGSFRYGATVQKIAQMKPGRNLRAVADVLYSKVQEQRAVRLIVEGMEDVYMALPQ